MAKKQAAGQTARTVKVHSASKRQPAPAGFICVQLKPAELARLVRTSTFEKTFHPGKPELIPAAMWDSLRDSGRFELLR